MPRPVARALERDLALAIDHQFLLLIWSRLDPTPHLPMMRSPRRHLRPQMMSTQRQMPTLLPSVYICPTLHANAREKHANARELHTKKLQ